MRALTLRSAAAALALLFASGRARADEAQECIAAAEHAQPLRAAGHLHEARDELLVCARAACPRLVRADCARWLDEVEAATPTIVPLARDARGADVRDVSVSIDGAPAATVDGKAVRVDPGRHALRFEARDGRAADVAVVVGAGEKNRVIAAVLPSREVEAPHPPATAPAATAPAASRGPVPLGAYVLGGVAVVGVAGFAGLGLWAKHDVDDLRDSCAPTCASRDVSSARAKAYGADASLVVAAIAAAAAVWLVVTRPASPTPARAHAPSAAFTF